MNKLFLFVFAGALITLAKFSLPVSASRAFAETSAYLYNFNSAGTLEEAARFSQSTSLYWWLNSGAYLKIYGGLGHTNASSLPSTDYWRLLYKANNPVDTDNGYHPQNIFRLVSQGTWQNARQEAYFRIDANNLSSSPNRNQSNGLLFFNRYLNGDNLYYTGLRVDGAAVIKKKQNGTYYTMAYVPAVFPGVYDRSANPNLLPERQWIGLRSEVTTQIDGSVRVTFFLDKNNSGSWQKVAEATDVSGKYGGAPITRSGHAGIRTDFMDVSFENFRVSSL